MYALACEENGVVVVHNTVGFEPSGLSFNEVSLNASNRPHNPMINSGAIATCSLVGQTMDYAEKFTYVMDSFEAMAGGSKVSTSGADKESCIDFLNNNNWL